MTLGNGRELRFQRGALFLWPVLKPVPDHYHCLARCLLVDVMLWAYGWSILPLAEETSRMNEEALLSWLLLLGFSSRTIFSVLNSEWPLGSLQFTLSWLSSAHVRPHRARTCAFPSLRGQSAWDRWGLFKISSVSPRCCFSTCSLTFSCIFPPVAMFFLILPCYNLPCFLWFRLTHPQPSLLLHPNCGRMGPTLHICQKHFYVKELGTWHDEGPVVQCCTELQLQSQLKCKKTAQPCSKQLLRYKNTTTQQQVRGAEDHFPRAGAEEQPCSLLLPQVRQ